MKSRLWVLASLALTTALAAIAPASAADRPAGLGWSPRQAQGSDGDASAHARVRLDEHGAPIGVPRAEPNKPSTTPRTRMPNRATGEGSTARPARAPSDPSLPLTGTPSPEVASFEAIADDNTRVPPDVAGAVGPTKLVVMNNAQYSIQDRDGTNGSPQSLDSFWSPLAGSHDPFDPRVVFDPISGRFIAAAVSNAASTSSEILLGVSDDETPSSWDLFSVAIGSSTLWADFPILGFNKNWIVVTVNMFTIADDTFDHSRIYVFRKSKVFANITTDMFRLFNDSTIHPDEFDRSFALVPAVTYDATQGSLFLVEDYWGEIDIFDDGNLWGVLRISKVSGSVGAETYTTDVGVFTDSEWDDGFSAAQPTEFAPQSGTTRKIDTGDARMQSCVVRNGTIWCAHTVYQPGDGDTDTAPTRATVQWWQFDFAGTVKQRARIEDPANVVHYAYPSIAVNDSGDVLIGYSRFSGTTFASAEYSFRSNLDAASTLRDTAVLKEGEASYEKDLTGSIARWGDYTTTMVDPLNDGDLWTIGQYAESEASSTGDPDVDDRWGMWWGHMPSTTFDVPISITGTLDAFFADPVGPLENESNFVVSDVSAGGTTVDGALECFDDGGLTVDCALGTTVAATFTPTSLLTPGKQYQVTVNPSGVGTPVEQSGTPVAYSSRKFKVTSEEESSKAAKPMWRSVTSGSAIGGSYHTDHLGGATASFSFTGARVIWYTVTSPAQGLADVFIDNVFKGTFNQYSAVTRYGQVRAFTVPDGTHTIKIVPKGLKGSGSGTDTHVAVDAFRVYPASGGNGTLFANPTLTFTWRTVPTPLASGGRYAIGNIQYSTFWFTFYGTSLDWVTIMAPTMGRAAVYEGNALRGAWDNYSATTKFGIKRHMNFANGFHTIRVVVAGTKNASATGTYVAVDRFIAS